MAKITECKHYFLFIRTDRDSEYPEMNIEYFNDPNNMLDEIDRITKESIKQGKSCIRHIDYDYTYFI